MPGFTLENLDDRVRLYHDSDVRYHRIIGKKTGCIYYLLGCAIQTDKSCPSPKEVLLQEEFAELEQAIASWSGRYALITNRFVYSDILGLMRLFYWQDDKDFCITNSLRFIQTFVGQLNIRPLYYETELHFKDMISWHPGPATMYKEVFCLMYKQYMELKEGKCVLKTISTPYTDYDGMSTEQLMELLDSYMSTYLLNIACEFEHILIPLSGGKDSRTLVSYALKNKIKFSCYTCDKRDIQYHDKLIPRLICKRCHIPHHYVRKPFISKKQREVRLKIFNEQTSNLMIDRDREYYAYKQIPNRKHTVVLGGSIWELTSKAYSYLFDDYLDVKAPASMVFSNWNPAPLVTELLEEYLKYVRTSPCNLQKVLFCDRFYMEQRAGCFASGIEQGWDLSDTVRLQPLNARNIIELLLAVAKRNELDFQKKLMQRNCPELLDYPINNLKPSLYQRAKNKIERLIYRD